MDGDLVDIGTFGEGWNFGPTLGVNVPVTGNLMVSFGAGYTFRGVFNREGAVVNGVQGVTRLNPGDVATVNASIGYDGGRFASELSGSYSTETITRLDGSSLYKSGDRYLVAANAGYQWTENWSSKIAASFSHFGKNHVRQVGLPDLAVEAFNSNSRLTRVALDTTYREGNFAIGPTAGYLHRNVNSWNPLTFQFLPAKTRWSAGVFAQYAATPRARFNARVERLWVKESESPDKFVLGLIVPGSGVPAVSSDAWQVSVGGLFQL
jgi:hypothetical protein